MRSSESKLRKGDCSSWTSRPWRSVPSNTESPVVLAKSASTIVSFSDSFAYARECQYQPAVAITTAITAARESSFHRELLASNGALVPAADAGLRRALEIFPLEGFLCCDDDDATVRSSSSCSLDGCTIDRLELVSRFR